jgi:N-acetylmuramoyl-L-alanine amidase-like protein
MRRGLATLALVALAGCGGGGDSVRVPSANPTVAQRPAPAPAGGAEGTTTPAAEEPEGESAAEVVPRPPIVQWRIPFGDKRRREMAAYSLRHYGESEWRLIDPQVVVEHWTQTSSVRATRDIFVPDKADAELHERPGTCSHFVIARSGTIYQLVDLGTRCRHAFAMNWTAIGIEHVGYSDADVMDNPRQLAASLALTRWLRCRYGIPVRNVIGHAETARSPYWREIRRKGRDTHDDMGPRAMSQYRSRLARHGCA